jgi:hypothetical protein
MHCFHTGRCLWRGRKRGGAESRVRPIGQQVQIKLGLLSATGALLALTVNSCFALIPLMIGSGLLFAGLTGFCGLALR